MSVLYTLIQKKILVPTIERTGGSGAEVNTSSKRTQTDALRRRRVAALPAQAALGLALQSLRHEQGLTQTELASRLGVGQAALSRAEQRGDLLVSTLTAYVEAVGGRLDVRAVFTGGRSVRLVAEPTFIASQLQMDELLGVARPPCRDVILSVRPRHAEKILAGDKTVELRRRFIDEVGVGSLALIYTTSPVRALTGSVEIQEVQRLPVRDLWHRHRVTACLPKSDFEAYFEGLDHGYAIILSRPRQLMRPVALAELRERFSFAPPQSYQYARQGLRGLVEDERPQNPDRH
jgi:predicted transcriptional regulator/DNA-binding XRE family transcriptional regulator